VSEKYEAYGSGNYGSVDNFGGLLVSPPVINNTDGTNFPQATPGWTVQGIQQFVHVYNPVVSGPDKTNIPYVGTVQGSAGSDQNTVAHAGV
jgi:hypothetical protein